MAADGTRAHAVLRRVFASFDRAGGLAYRHVDGDLSFKGLHSAARALASRLAADGDSPVLIYGHKDRRFLVAYWAALLSGRTAVPVETGTAPARLAQIARVSGAGCVLMACPGIATAEMAGLPAWPVETETYAQGFVRMDYCTLGQERALPEDVPDNAVAYILFSSGTTGQPKGIAVTYANLADFTDWCGTLLDSMDPAGCISGNVRYCFDVSLFEMWFSWLSLRPVSALDHRELFNTARLIERYRTDRLTTWVSTPSLALHWCRDRRFCAEMLPELHTMLFCGEILPKSLVETLWERFPGLRIINTYGPTECTVAVTSIEITRAHLNDPRALPIGRARAGTRLCGARQDTGAATAVGAADELMIKGRSVGPGYLSDPQQQARAFPAPQTYLTGDWGQQEDGVWYFNGRKDREIKLQGHRIDLNTVEAALRGIEGIDDAVVDLHANKRGLRAFVLGCTGSAALQQAADQLAGALAGYMVPRFWYGADSFDLNASSKLDRKRFVAALETAKPVIWTAQKAAPDAPPEAARIAAE